MSDHPTRAEYPDDVSFWRACAEHLDRLWPSRTQYRERLAAWRRLEALSDPEATLSRIHELLSQERPFTDDEAHEWDVLTESYRALRRMREEASP